MIQTSRGNKNYWIRTSLLHGGAIIVIVASFIIMDNIALSAQWINSLVCAVTCLSCGVLHYKILGPNHINQKPFRLVVILGLIEFIIAGVFYKTLSVNDVLAFKWIIWAFPLSVVAYLGSYNLIVSALFPQVMKVTATPLLDPITELSQDLQEIINKGRLALYGTFGVTLMIFFFGGGIVGLFTFQDKDYGNFVSISILLGFIVGTVLSVIATYRWQKWAIKTGFPEDELKTAAKKVGLWWPKTKAHK